MLALTECVFRRDMWNHPSLILFSETVDIYTSMTDKLPITPATPDSGRWKPVQRAYPEGTEVLTDVGWVDFASLYNSQLLGKEIPFMGNGRKQPGFQMNELLWGQWATKAAFPRFATMNPANGEVSFVRPGRFIYYNYSGRLAHIKMKGVDILTTLFADMWLKPKYGRAWKFVLADDVIRNVHSSANYQMVNKFSVDMYGLYSPQEELGSSIELPVIGVDKKPVDAVSSSLRAFIDAPITLYPKRHAKRERVWNFYSHNFIANDGSLVEVDRIRSEVGCFNVDIDPYHNLIIRRGRKDNNPRTLWIGGPVVVGDGSDKSLLRVEGTKGAALGGGSYSIIRPDYRTLSTKDSFKKEEM